MLHATKQKKYDQTTESSVIRSPQEESSLINKYLHLVHGAIKKMGYINSISDSDDMRQVGLMTLLQMIRRFPLIEDEKEFSRLAYIRIRGAILDEIRRRDWRPAEKRQHANKFTRYEKQLAQSLGYLPSKTEMLQLTDINEHEYEAGRYAVNARSFVELSDELLQGYEDETCLDSDTLLENQQLIKVGLEQLNEEETLILHLMYEQDMSFKEMALATNNNFSRINKIQRDAHRKLTRLLAHKGDENA